MRQVFRLSALLPEHLSRKNSVSGSGSPHVFKEFVTVQGYTPAGTAGAIRRPKEFLFSLGLAASPPAPSEKKVSLVGRGPAKPPP